MTSDGKRIDRRPNRKLAAGMWLCSIAGVVTMAPLYGLFLIGGPVVRLSAVDRILVCVAWLIPFGFSLSSTIDSVRMVRREGSDAVGGFACLLMLCWVPAWMAVAYWFDAAARALAAS